MTSTPTVVDRWPALDSGRAMKTKFHQFVGDFDSGVKTSWRACGQSGAPRSDWNHSVLRPFSIHSGEIGVVLTA